MNIRLTLHIQGALLVFLGVTLLVPVSFSLYHQDGQTLNFTLAAAFTLLFGVLLYSHFRCREEITLREGFGIVTFGWLNFALFGSLPYLLSGVLGSPLDAFFEAMSGFTTTGATMIPNLETVPESILLWRSFTQWLGGMGFIVLGLAILPFLGVGGMELYEAETPGPTAERLTPRIQDTARLLWGVYALMTLLGVIFLYLGEMNFFESVCHTFSAVSTGGFSTRNASAGAFTTYSQMVILLLMILGSTSFTLHYYTLRGNLRSFWKSGEFRLFISLLAGITLTIALVNWGRGSNFLLTLRDAAFSTTAVLTTTGFASADYTGWPMLAQGLIFAMMFVGGCAGSTAGGLKLVRLLLLLKHTLIQTSKLVHPRQVRVLKLDGRPVSSEIMQGVLGFTVLYFGVFIIAFLLLTASGLDLITAGSAAIACLSSVGPGLGEVGPAFNYSTMPAFAKIVLSACMLLGRLEIATVLVLFSRSFWSIRSGGR